MERGGGVVCVLCVLCVLCVVCVVCVVCCVLFVVCCVVWCVVCVVCAVCVVRFFLSCIEERSCVYVQQRPCHVGQGRFERTHGSVLKVASLALHLFLSSRASLSSCVSLLFLFLSLFISPSFSSLSITLSITKTMIARPVSSLCTHGPDLP